MDCSFRTEDSLEKALKKYEWKQKHKYNVLPEFHYHSSSELEKESKQHSISWASQLRQSMPSRSFQICFTYIAVTLYKYFPHSQCTLPALQNEQKPGGCSQCSTRSELKRQMWHQAAQTPSFHLAHSTKRPPAPPLAQKQTELTSVWERLCQQIYHIPRSKCKHLFWC